MTTMADVIVVGGGLVGASCALALAQQGLQVSLLDSKMPSTHNAVKQNWDSRIYAISPGNAAWLQTLGVWNTLDHERVCAIENMHIWADANDEPLEFKSYEANATDLGFIVENRQLQESLWLALEKAGVNLLTGLECTALNVGRDQATLEIADGRCFTSKLVVAADGGNSWLRGQASIPVQSHDYEQLGVVANFETELPHRHIARQWFREDGVLAWLPLPGKRISMVWSTANDKARHMLGLDAEALAAEVAEAGAHLLGSLTTITAAVAFPLSMQTAYQLVQPRLVLVGDAAHLIHPLAGQGVNLGFRDVIALTDTLAQRSVYQDIGDVILLRHYERARKADMLAMRYLTHGMHALFNNQYGMIKQVRNWGLSVTNRRSALKKYLIKQAAFN